MSTKIIKLEKIPRESIILIFVLSVIIAFFIGSYLRPKSNLDYFNYGNLSKIEDLWEYRINAVGADQAYKEFKEIYKNETSSQHSLAHIFGELLYKNEGIDGVAICDDSFSYGCYHSFLGSAIINEGVGIINRLNDKCIETLKTGEESGRSCQHGIGHGILVFYGYGYDGIVNALNICDSLKGSDKIGDCFGGVFMEYNFKTMLMESESRVFDIKNPFFPCSELPEKFRLSCYYWLPQYWEQVLKGDRKEKYKTIGVWCKEVNNTNESARCFMGAGNIGASLSNGDIKKIKELCAQFSLEGEDLCRIGATEWLNGQSLDIRKQASELCKDIDDKLKQICFSSLKLN